MPRDRKPTPLWRMVCLIVAAIAVVWGGVRVWRDHVRDHVTVRNFGEVREGAIYRSGVILPEMLKRLARERGIRTVVDLGAHDGGAEGDVAMQAAADRAGVKRVLLGLHGDGTGDPNDYVQALRMMLDESNYPMLVHCRGGSERTGVLVMLYRRVAEGKTFCQTYPETFEFKHDRGDWKMLAYLADWGDKIIEAERTGGRVVGYVDKGKGALPGAGVVPGDEPLVSETPASAAP